MKNRLLIVDDDHSVRKVLERILQKEGYECFTAEDAESARELLKSGTFDMLLCDIIMPGESGLDLIRFCSGTYSNMGVIIITGIADPEFAREVFTIGPYGYIVKPFSNEQIVITVENALRRFELENAQKRRSEELETMVQARTIALQETIERLKDAKNSLEESEKKFRTVIEKAGEGIAIVQARKYVYVNQSLLGMFGYENPEEIVGQSMKKILHPDEWERLLRTHDRRMAGEEVPSRFLFKGVKKTGEEVIVEVSVVRINYDGKNASLAFFRDVTENIRIQSALKESENRFKAIFENAPVGIKIVSAQSRKIVTINRAGETILGRSRNEIVNRPCWEFVCPESKESCTFIHAEKENSSRETTIAGPDGQCIQVTKTMAPFSLEKGDFFIEIFTDITDQKRAAAELKKAHREKEEVIKSIPSILIGVTPEGLVSQCNPVMERVFGISAAEILHRPFSQCGIPWDWPRVEAAVADCLKKNHLVSLEKLRFTQPDGKEGFLGVTFTPVESDNAHRKGFLMIGANITSRITLELQLAQARKLEAIGQLAAGIAHEINTPTQYINDNILFFRDAFNDMKPALEHYRDLPEKLLKEGVTEALLAAIWENISGPNMDYLLSEIPEALEQTLEGVDRVSTIVRSMKEFSHPGVKEKTAVDINRAIENTVVVSRNEWKYTANLETDLDPGLPPVFCLPAEVNQVLLNIITNAAHAIGGGIEDGDTEKGLIKISTRVKGDSAEIEISDSGGGIPEDAQPRIFEPFFTTKEVGKGTGQGLAISRSVIVDKHGGTLTFATKQGEGTSFFIRLPLEKNGNGDL